MDEGVFDVFLKNYLDCYNEPKEDFEKYLPSQSVLNQEEDAVTQQRVEHQQDVLLRRTLKAAIEEPRCVVGGAPKPAHLFNAIMGRSMQWTCSSRKKTFENWPLQMNQRQKLRMIEAGFIYTGQSDVVNCVGSQECKIGGWLAKDIPLRKHARSFPKCPFVLCFAPISMQSKGCEGIDFEDASFQKTRHSTFPAQYRSVAGRCKLATAGFIFNGKDVICFLCSCKLEHPELERQPFNWHVLNNPECPFVLASFCTRKL